MKNRKQDCNEEPKKERHIVTWTQEEDDTLREQISIHGTNNWAIIASNFKGKTTRQCRRRYYSYLNCEFKRGGWSAEEDTLLCEAQKKFGNRWTEIAKVVPGRTDNAVKNRFSTLCKKREKDAALENENNTPVKKMRRAHIPDDAEKINFGDRSHLQNGTSTNLQPREPLAVLAQNSHNIKNLPDQDHNVKFSCSGQNNKNQGAFVIKDTSKISALMQQSELLNSLAQNVDKDNMDQSFENSCKVVEDYLNQIKGSDTPCQKIPDLRLPYRKDMIEDFKSSNEGGQPCSRQRSYADSLGSSEADARKPERKGPKTASATESRAEEYGHSTGSALLPHSAGDNLEHSLPQDIRTGVKATENGDKEEVSGGVKGVVLSTEDMDQDMLPHSEEQINKYGIVSASSRTEFNSPLQANPIFRSLTAGIPSPQFSDSERSFLKKTLGVESPSFNPSANLPTPTCKRNLDL